VALVALAAAALMLPFLMIDLTFLSANMLKVVQGGWVPLALGGVVMLVMYTWRRGTRILYDKTRRLETPLDDLVRMLERKPPQRVPGTAVFLTSDPKSAPTALCTASSTTRCCTRRTSSSASRPRTRRASTTPSACASSRSARPSCACCCASAIWRRRTFRKALAIARKLGWQFDIMSTSFFLSRRALRPAPHSGMPRWQDRLFITLARSANDATDYFQIPTDRVVEVGTQVTV
jgi:KUP system potassium uptake protein